MEHRTQTYVLSIAGFDPSGGAGLLRDASVIEDCGAKPLGVCTAITAQNYESFGALHHLPLEQILEQIAALKIYPVKAAKIGLIKNCNYLTVVLNKIQEIFPGLPTVWDPVLASSTGGQFFDLGESNGLDTILSKLSLSTPNAIESEKLLRVLGLKSWLDIPASVLVKGGHKAGECAVDQLITDGEQHEFSSPRLAVNMRGTGCTLSSLIACNLAQGLDLKAAISEAKSLMQRYLESEVQYDS